MSVIRKSNLPILLLDVDGVLLPFGGGHRTSAWHTRHEDHDSNYIPEAILARLKKLQERFDIRWCTGWEDEANTILAPLNHLPQYPVVPILSVLSEQIQGQSFFEPDAFGAHWKLNAIESYIEGIDVPIAFLDDDIGTDAVEWAEAQERPLHFEPCNSWEGLTDESVERLIRFANNKNRLPKELLNSPWHEAENV